MKIQNCHIMPYTEELLHEITELERGILQGKNVKLELVKEHFLDRAKVFKNTYPCIALSNEKHAIGLVVGARTKLTINDIPIDAGIAFDTKVHPAWRNKGVGGMLAKHIYKQFFIPQGLKNNFVTAKKNNAPVLKLISRTIANIWIYDFVYLTVPTSNRVEPQINTGKQLQQFSVQLFNKEEISDDYYSQSGNGLGYFYTYKMYRLRIKKISWLYKFGIIVLKGIKPSKYAALPREHDLLSFATLYNHSVENIHGINEVLEQLERKDIGQLLVCCRKKDAIYKTLKNISVNEYGYYIVSDFKLDKKDRLAIDVRCL